MSDQIARLARYSGKGPMTGICLDSHGMKIHQVTSAEQHVSTQPLGPHYHNGWVCAGQLIAIAIDGNGAAHPLREVRYEPGEEIARWRLQ